MLHLQNVVHCLRIKWMEWACKDMGSSWSRFIWPKIEDIIPFQLIGGAQAIKESYLSGIIPFYYAMIHSYLYVNNLFYKANPHLELPQNIWFTSLFPYLDRKWHSARLLMVTDLPVESNKIQITAVKSALGVADPALYYKCCLMQQHFQGQFLLMAGGTHMVHPLAISQSKHLLQDEHSVMLSLAR